MDSDKKPNASLNRAYALDALRGFAILTMVLSGVIPYHVLPSWMYHAQLPPPDHVFNPNLPGFTWVDLVFPLFLFALGAAIPLAISRKIENRISGIKLVFSILERGFLLGFFAIFLRHVRPYMLNPHPDTQHWLIAILGFVLMFALFTRFLASWSQWLKRILRGSGWVGAIVLLILLRYPDGSRFSLGRSDIIIIVLTNVAVFGSLIWYITRDNQIRRLGVLGILIALRLAHTEPGWIHWLWNATPVPWIYKLYYLQYLFIVIPGTIIGDILNQWIKKEIPHFQSPDKWSARRLTIIAGLMVVFVLVSLTGLHSRWLWQTTVLGFILCAIGWFLVFKPNSDNEYLIHSLFSWGIFWFILGLIFEPYEGGIKKDHPTLSYYFVTTGLSIFILIAFTIIIDIFKKKKWLQLLIDNGQNPMIAYVGFANFIWPILALTGIEKYILDYTRAPWIGFVRGLFYTFLVAWIVRFFTRKKIFWRT